MSDSADVFLEYCIKKAEKISNAIYILSDFIPSSDPMRHSLREISIRLVSDIFSIRDLSNTNEKADTNSAVFKVASRTIPEILSLLNISRSSGFISDMNASILIRELKTFQAILGERFNIKTALLLSRKDFYVPEVVQAPQSVLNRIKADKDGDSPQFSYKGQKSYIISKGQKSKKVETKKSKRRATILSIIKDKDSITIRDACLKLSEYSEKTIQREIVKMVKEGILRKEGERRWSKYFLVHQI